jgi:hypothetical protein
MIRALLISLPLFGACLTVGCHEDHDDRDRHARWEREHRRDEVIVVPVRGEVIRDRDRDGRRDRD